MLAQVAEREHSHNPQLRIFQFAVEPAPFSKAPHKQNASAGRRARALNSFAGIFNRAYDCRIELKWFNFPRGGAFSLPTEWWIEAGMDRFQTP
jgi:hypothetical protein